jgi:hypothetical protein
VAHILVAELRAPRREEEPINRQRAMKSLVNLELIFPIKDAPSASFMCFKARCLRDAGIISESEKALG